MEKSSSYMARLSDLPFEEYIHSIPDGEARMDLIEQIKRKACIASDITIYRFRKGVYRPDMLKRREIASVIRRHSGNKEWTGDNLFPVAFYQKKN